MLIAFSENVHCLADDNCHPEADDCRAEQNAAAYDDRHPAADGRNSNTNGSHANRGPATHVYPELLERPC